MKILQSIVLLFAFLSSYCFSRDLYVLADLNRTSTESNGESVIRDLSGSGYTLGLGYEINRNFSLELSYSDLMDVADKSSSFLTASSQTVSFSATQFSLVTKYPLENYVDVFARVGVSRVNENYSLSEHRFGSQYEFTESLDEDFTSPVFGIGLDYMNQDTWGLRAEYGKYYNIDNVTLYTLKLGITYHF